MKRALGILMDSLEEKRRWHTVRCRVRRLSEDYRKAYSRLEHYYFVCGLGSMEVLEELLGLFETSSERGEPVRQVTGEDAVQFAEEFASALLPDWRGDAKKLNEDVAQYLNRKDDSEC